MEAPSPMKGLERLTEELRLERQKSSYALQEKARIRVEIESYKQIIDDQKAQITDFQEKLDTFVRQARDAEQQIHTLSDQDRLSRNEAKQHQTRIQDIEAELAAANEEIDNYKQVLVGRDHEINELRVQYETLQKKTVTKDELIASLKDELLSVRRSQMAFEEEKEAVYARLSEQTAQNEQLRAQLQLVGEKESGYSATFASNEELRDALEQTLQLNTILTEQVRDLQSRLTEKSAQKANLELQHAAMTETFHDMQNLLQRAEDAQHEAEARLHSEISGKEAAQAEVEEVRRSKDGLEEQAGRWKEAYEDALQRASTLEQEITQHKVTIAAAHEEIHGLKDAVQQVDALQRQVDAQANVSLELEMLRGQLQSMRRKLVKKDLEEDAQHLVAPRALIEREQQSRMVYEKIIEELRHEVDRVTHLYHETATRCEELSVAAAQVDALQDELALYKETAQAATKESHTLALSAAEVAERSTKAAHERHAMQQTLQETQRHLHSVQTELSRLTSEHSALKDKVKTFHAQKLQAEQRATETGAERARLAAQLEEVQRRCDEEVLAREDVTRRWEDEQRARAELQQRYVELERHVDSVTDAQAQTRQRSEEAQTLQRQQTRQLETLQVERSLLQQEVTSLREQVAHQKTAFDGIQQENSALRRDLDDSLAERDRLRQESDQQLQHMQHEQLHALQSELAHTMQEWTALEQESSAKDALVAQLQVDYAREKEKAVLLKMQLSLSEERLQTLTQEVSVYRGIDVYHAGRQAELSRHLQQQQEHSANDDSNENKHHETGRNPSEPKTNSHTVKSSGTVNGSARGAPHSAYFAESLRTQAQARLSLAEITGLSTTKTQTKSDKPANRPKDREVEDSDDDLPGKGEREEEDEEGVGDYEHPRGRSLSSSALSFHQHTTPRYHTSSTPPPARHVPLQESPPSSLQAQLQLQNSTFNHRPHSINSNSSNSSNTQNRNRSLLRGVTQTLEHLGSSRHQHTQSPSRTQNQNLRQTRSLGLLGFNTTSFTPSYASRVQGGNSGSRMYGSNSNDASPTSTDNQSYGSLLQSDSQRAELLRQKTERRLQRERQLRLQILHEERQQQLSASRRSTSAAASNANSSSNNGAGNHSSSALNSASSGSKYSRVSGGLFEETGRSSGRALLSM